MSAARLSDPRAESLAGAATIAALPEFPEMKPLELSDRAAMESCTNRLPCSSDHAFTGRWIWNTGRPERIARIGANLVIEFADYATHEPRVTLIGDDEVAAAARHALSSGTERLDCVPEFVADGLAPSHFVIEHDRDQDDYVLDVNALATLAGRGLGNRRREAHNCERRLGARLRTAPVIRHPQADLLELFDRWTVTRGKSEADTGDERKAVERLVDSWPALNLVSHSLYDGDSLIAAAVSEVLPDCAISHYQKADASYAGIFPLLQRSHCRQLAALGVRELNFEQDLGIEGMRASKLRYRPVRFVHKYRVQLRS